MRHITRDYQAFLPYGYFTRWFLIEGYTPVKQFQLKITLFCAPFTNFFPSLLSFSFLFLYLLTGRAWLPKEERRGVCYTLKSLIYNFFVLYVSSQDEILLYVRSLSISRLVGTLKVLWFFTRVLGHLVRSLWFYTYILQPQSSALYIIYSINLWLQQTTYLIIDHLIYGVMSH